DTHLRAVDQPDAEVAERALERDRAALEDPDADRVLGARVLDRHVGDPLLVDQVAQLEIDLAGRELGGVEHRGRAVDLGDVGNFGVGFGQAASVVGRPAPAGRPYLLHTSTCPSYGSYVSISWSISARIAISSDAIATRSSDSYSTSGFAAISSFATPRLSCVTAMYVNTPSRSSRLS